MKRRNFIKQLGGLAALNLLPLQAFAQLKRKLFGEAELEKIISGVFGHSRVQNTVAIDLRIPLTVSNPQNVPVTVRTRLEGARRIALLAHRQPYPLLAVFELSPYVLPEAATRIQLSASGEISALVETRDGRLYQVTRYVELLTQEEAV